MKEKLHIFEQSYKLQRADRESSNGHKAACLWFTGLSGSGKSTLANYVEQVLFEKEINTLILDGDNIRKGLCSDLSFTEADRIENLRRVGEVAKLMCEAGLVVMATFISPYERERQKLRERIGESFIEIFIDAPLGVCEQRDVKGLYKKARLGEISNFTGISSPFEPPVSPEIYINTADQTLEESADLILEYILPRIQVVS